MGCRYEGVSMLGVGMRGVGMRGKHEGCRYEGVRMWGVGMRGQYVGSRHKGSVHVCQESSTYAVHHIWWCRPHGMFSYLAGSISTLWCPSLYIVFIGIGHPLQVASYKCELTCSRGIWMVGDGTGQILSSTNVACSNKHLQRIEMAGQVIGTITLQLPSPPLPPPLLLGEGHCVGWLICAFYRTDDVITLHWNEPYIMFLFQVFAFSAGVQY